MRLWPDGAPLNVRADPSGQPLTFIWDRELHKVTSIEDVREARLDWWAATGEIHRVYYLVVTNQGLICEVYRDEVGGEGREPGAWWMARVWD